MTVVSVIERLKLVKPYCVFVCHFRSKPIKPNQIGVIFFFLYIPIILDSMYCIIKYQCTNVLGEIIENNTRGGKRFRKSRKKFYLCFLMFCFALMVFTRFDFWLNTFLNPIRILISNLIRVLLFFLTLSTTTSKYL